jgi:hypothetical protein
MSYSITASPLPIGIGAKANERLQFSTDHAAENGTPSLAIAKSTA